MGFESVTKFENKLANFFGSPFAVAVDCCTHGLELCLRYTKAETFSTPSRTYLSVPFLAHKLNIEHTWRYVDWKDYYHITNNIIKHLSLGRGGIILTDNREASIQLKKMSYDGRLPNVPWRDQDIDTLGYHYYMTPETAQLGLDKFDLAVQTPPRQWSINDWPDLTKMKIFN